MEFCSYYKEFVKGFSVRTLVSVAGKKKERNLFETNNVKKSNN